MVEEFYQNMKMTDGCYFIGNRKGCETMNNLGLGGRVYGVTPITTKSGVSMTKFRLQVSRYKKDAFYIEVIAFDKNAEFIAQHVKDGSGVFVSGKLDEETWMKDDVKQYRLKLLADRIEFLPSIQKKEVTDTDNTNGVNVDEPAVEPEEKTIPF